MVSLRLPTTPARAQWEGEYYSDQEEAVLSLQFGGGPHVLLAACTIHDVAVFRLDHTLQDLVSTSYGWVHNGGVELEGRSSHLVCHTQIQGDYNAISSEGTKDVCILGISWTSQLDGILVSDSTKSLTMWELTTYDGATTLDLCWKVTAPEVQDIVSAGVGVHAPCASACSRGETHAIIWWPKVEMGMVDVRSEKLRHPSCVRSIEWSPGVLRKDSLERNCPASESDRENDEYKEAQLSDLSQQKHVEDHPAIMTLDIDGYVRVWVEMLVVHYDEDNPQGPNLDSYFAMTLLIDPPSLFPGAHSPFESQLYQHRDQRQGPFDPALICTWAKPTDSFLGKPVGSKSINGRVLWLVTGSGGAMSDSGTYPLLRLRLYAVRGLSAVVVSSSQGSMAGVSTMRTGTKRPQVILWGEHMWNATFPFRLQADETNDNLPSRFFSRVTNGDEFPKIICFASSCDSFSGLGVGGRGVCGAGITFVTALSELVPSSPASVHQLLEIEKSWFGKTYMHSAVIENLLVLKGLVVSQDAAGILALWSIDKQREHLQPLDVLHLSLGERKLDTTSILRRLKIVSSAHAGNSGLNDVLVVSRSGMLLLIGNFCSPVMMGRLKVLATANISSGELLDILSYAKDSSMEVLIPTHNEPVVFFGLISKSTEGVVLSKFALTRTYSGIEALYDIVKLEEYSGILQGSGLEAHDLCLGRHVNGFCGDDSFVFCTSEGQMAQAIEIKSNLSCQYSCRRLMAPGGEILDLCLEPRRRLLAMATRLDGIEGVCICQLEKDDNGSSEIAFLRVSRYERILNAPKGKQITSIAWVQDEVIPCLAVGFSGGSMSLFSCSRESRNQSWGALGTIKAPRECHVLNSSSRSVLAVSFGSCVGMVSKLISPNPSRHIPLSR